MDTVMEISLLKWDNALENVETKEWQCAGNADIMTFRVTVANRDNLSSVFLYKEWHDKRL